MTNVLRIRELNDLARTAMGVRSQVFLTEGIHSMPEEDQSAVLEAVMKFDAFDKNNDPYGEHDFGSIEYKGRKIYWKIDYYNKTMDGGSEDPADPSVTRRILTIMLASEY